MMYNWLTWEYDGHENRHFVIYYIDSSFDGSTISRLHNHQDSSIASALLLTYSLTWTCVANYITSETHKYSGARDYCKSTKMWYDGFVRKQAWLLDLTAWIFVPDFCHRLRPRNRHWCILRRPIWSYPLIFSRISLRKIPVYSLLVRLNTGHTVLEQLQNALNISLHVWLPISWLLTLLKQSFSLLKTNNSLLR